MMNNITINFKIICVGISFSNMYLQYDQKRNKKKQMVK